MKGSTGSRRQEAFDCSSDFDQVHLLGEMRLWILIVSASLQPRHGISGNDLVAMLKIRCEMARRCYHLQSREIAAVLLTSISSYENRRI